MPPALALLLLAGLSAPGGWGCLQCDRSVQEALSQLRVAIVPSRFHVEQLRTRAQALLRGMQGPFFRDYALNAFVGKAEVDPLDHVASLIKNQVNILKSNALRDWPLLEELVSLRENAIQELKKVLRSYELKDLLKEEVLDCLHCLKISPNCIKKKYCFGLLHTDKTGNSCCSKALVWGFIRGKEKKSLIKSLTNSSMSTSVSGGPSPAIGVQLRTPNWALLEGWGPGLTHL
ncbi:izumo sperm-egg fusion protein 2 isoform X2 [Pteropus medius]|uniref:izumo sperm-egg fusion protein 2 isoform X2 n=1 Tax=Pteropus vampyrus TaxID=132908 RepID=UPI00196AD7CE|nr:izumo sperm-egg fusion protein 2 isoform X2 [Pteropus giganteus]